MNRLAFFLVFVITLGMNSSSLFGQYQEWKHTAPFFIITTPDGANLPADAKVIDFPFLVRLQKDFFDFSKAKPNGHDIRFSDSKGKALKYQIEHWDTKNGSASIWVKIPVIEGNQRQKINLHWGKTSAASESNGPSVFNESNGYAAVIHMDESLDDSTNSLNPKDQGTSDTAGIIGRGRRFSGKQGIALGENIAGFSTAANPSSTEAWFKPAKPNGTVVAWGKEQKPGKIMMNILSPPRIAIQCYFADVEARGSINLNEWVQVVHTYEKGNSRVYVNGILDGNSSPILDIPTPARMWIGGWYNNYNYIGDVDEVRVSKVSRSPDWIKLQFENQKPLHTASGLLVSSGDEFKVSTKEVSILEGKTVTIKAEVKGAQKLYWSINKGGKETVVATDLLSFNVEAGRVTSDTNQVVKLKAIFPNEIRSIEIPVVIREDIPEPLFTLNAPTQWDGRQPIEIVPVLSNLEAMASKGAGQIHYSWNVSGIAVIKEVMPEKLLLKRAQNSGKMTVTLAINNGGAEIIKSITLDVKEPKKDLWVNRKPSADEKPEDNQFYPRDDKNEGTLFYNGKLEQPADRIFLKVFEEGKLFKQEFQKPSDGNSYAFSVKLKPALVNYRIEFGFVKDDMVVVLRKVNNIVCGDAYIIQGQSNAVATDFGKETPSTDSNWVRSFGSTSGSPDGSRLKVWDNASYRGQKGEKAQIGYWGMELGKRLVEANKVPVCFINGAVGGSRIDQHQRNNMDPEDVSTIYGRLLWRVRQAGLTHGIKAVIWHQGENDQGADGPTGGYGWETYLNFFVDLSASWKNDFPNLQNYYVFQIWPKSCSMGVKGSDNMLREVQRSLPNYFSNLSVMSTLGINPPGGCHFPAAGYAEFARMICPLMERDLYGKSFLTSITPANLLKASFSNSEKSEIKLVFDQEVKWANTLITQFNLEGISGELTSGSSAGNIITLKLKNPSKANTITYLDSKAWNGNNLLLGANGIAALTFCNVPILMKE